MFLQERLPNAKGSIEIEWNFEKFLIDHKGNTYKRFDPRQNPIPDMVVDIEYLLKVREIDA